MSSVLLTVNERGKLLGTRQLPDGIVASASDTILATSRFVAAAPGSVEGTYEIAIEPQRALRARIDHFMAYAPRHSSLRR